MSELNLNKEQIEILQHTERNQFFCGGSKDMDALCQARLMEYAGKKSFVPDPYYSITSAGRAALRNLNL